MLVSILIRCLMIGSWSRDLITKVLVLVSSHGDQGLGLETWWPRSWSWSSFFKNHDKSGSSQCSCTKTTQHVRHRSDKTDQPWFRPCKLNEVTIKPNSANFKYYQADVGWEIANTIKPTSVGKSQILSSWRRDVTTATLIFRNCMHRNTSLSHNPRWQQ